MGLLERCVAYKDEKARGLKADAGTFCYPVLMAADILIYDSDMVPVGEDQVQHLEVARDLAGSFNHEFGETFVLPKPKVLDNSARVPGVDGQKMSKSYGNTLAVFEEPKALKKQIMRIVTDSRQPDEAQAARRRSSFRALFALRHGRTAGNAGRHIPSRRLRLRRRKEVVGGNGGRVFRSRASAREESGRPSGKGPRDSQRRRGHRGRRPPRCCSGLRRHAG